MARAGLRKRYRDSRLIFAAALRHLRSERDLWLFAWLAGSVMLLSLGFAVAAAWWGVLPFWLTLVALMVALFPASIFGAMCQTAMARCVMERIAGRTCTRRDGWYHARSSIGVIVRVTAVATLVAGILAIVGMLLDRLRIVPYVGRVVQVVGTLGWATAVYFAVPIIAASRQTSALGVVKDSAALAREHWGKSIAGIVTIGLVLIVPMVLLLVPAFALAIWFAYLGWVGAAVVAFALPLTLPILALPLQMAAQTTYQAALYQFAKAGDAGTFSETALTAPWE